MTYAELIQLYFERSGALQSYWTLYVVIIGGLLAFSSLRSKPDLLTTALVSVLFCLFAYKNLGAIGDATEHRAAALSAIAQYDASASGAAEVKTLRTLLEPTLKPASLDDVKWTHISGDLLTLATLWAMEYRRRRLAKQSEMVGS